MSVITDALAQACRLRPGGQEDGRGKTMNELHDADPAETREWLDSLEGVIEVEGQDRAAFLLD